MKLSVVIVNFNSGRCLEKCIKSVIYRLGAAGNYEILVVDNMSSDDSLSALDTILPQVRIIRNNTNIGFVKGANQGIGNTEGEYVLVLNPDTELLDNNILSMCDYVERDPKIGICGPLLVNEDGTAQSGPFKFNGIFSELKFIAGLTLFNRMRGKKSHADPVSCEYVHGGCVLLRRVMLEKIGRFDDNIFMFAEEEEICYRAKKRGWGVFFYPSCRVLHRGQISSRGLERKRVANQRMSALYYYSKRYGIFSMAFMRLVFMTNTILRVFSAGLKVIFIPSGRKRSMEILRGNIDAGMLILKMKDSR